MKGHSAAKIARLAVLAITFLGLSRLASAAACDRTCLLEQARLFNAAMLAHATDKILLAPDAQIRENTKAIALSESKWFGVTKVLSEGVYADPILGNVIEHVTGQTTDGKAVYIGTRLKMVNGRIKEVEINFDDSARVNVKTIQSSCSEQSRRSSCLLVGFGGHRVEVWSLGAACSGRGPEGH